MNETNRIPSEMLALTATGTGFENLKLGKVPTPQIGENQLLARVDAAGVCSSNLKLIAQGPEHPFLKGWDLEQWPAILGDEGAVTLVKVGEGLADRFKPGERYAVQPAVDVAPILNRERYRNNAEGITKCAVGYTLGGMLAQYIRIQEEVLAAGCLVPLPDQRMPAFAVSMAEPISCVISAQDRHYHLVKEGAQAPREARLGIKPDGVTVVRGAGAMGRMHAELALRFRPGVLIVADYEENRLKKSEKVLRGRAGSCGCRLSFVSPDDLEATVMGVSNGRGADDYILALGIRKEHQKALALLAQDGVVNLFGGLPLGNHILELDSRDVHYREVHVVGSSGGDASDVAKTVGAIAAGEIDPGNYVAAVGSLHNAIDVLGMIRDRQLDGRAILYPHIRETPLRMVEGWNGEMEREFLQERIPES
ncbi:MAG: zinc-binding dehydrogenase [Kiritimatiellia bacterium]|jgi:threonine dehydrogenase-like Zn-dependent dehydrogenase|nr:zinc-binding dehydrogenase [Kiritimatiellia bacterium]